MGSYTVTPRDDAKTTSDPFAVPARQNAYLVAGTKSEKGNSHDSSTTTSYYALAFNGSAWVWGLQGGKFKASGNSFDSNSYDGSGGYVGTEDGEFVCGTISSQNGKQSWTANYDVGGTFDSSGVPKYTKATGSDVYSGKVGCTYNGGGGSTTDTVSAQPNTWASNHDNDSWTEKGDETVTQYEEYTLGLTASGGTKWTEAASTYADIVHASADFSSSQCDETKTAFNSNTGKWNTDEILTVTNSWHQEATIDTEIPSLDAATTVDTSGKGNSKGHCNDTSNKQPLNDGDTRDTWYLTDGEGTETSNTSSNKSVTIKDVWNGILNPPVSATSGPISFSSNSTVSSSGAIATAGTSASTGLGLSATGYDSAGHLTGLIDANGAITNFGYDAAGHLSSLTDAVGNTTSWSYDDAGRLASETDQLGDTKSYAYDDAGNLSQYTDADGRANTYQYDPGGNVTGETWYPSGSGQGSVASGQNGEGQGEGESAATPTNTIQYTRDSSGQITSESDNNSSDSYTYDSAGQIASTTEVLPDGPTVVLTYQYDSAGERTQMAAFVDSSCDFVDDYSYDSLGRVVSVVEHGVTGGDAVANKEIDLTYNSAGELATVDRYQDGVLAVEGDYTYDSSGNLIGLVYHQGDTVLASYAWTYSDGTATLVAGSSNADWLPSGGIVPVHDTSGITSALSSGGYSGVAEVTSCTSTDGTTSYSYDPTGQLLSATYTGDQSNESYTYDANGNRVTANGYVYSTGADNELLFDGTYTYAYDAEGNRTEKFIDVNADGVLDSGDTDVTQFTWDNRDRLTEVKTYATERGDPTEVVDYLYDVENRWIGENIDSNGDGQVDHQIRFAYDGNQIVLEFEKDGPGALDSSNLSHRYTWLPNAVDQLMGDEQLHVASSSSGYDLTTAGNVVWTLGDNQGTIKDLAVMDSGVTSVANHRGYDSYSEFRGHNTSIDKMDNHQ